MIKKLTGYVLFFILGGFLVTCIMLSQTIAEGVSYGLNICLYSLIPALFFFIAVSNIICNTQLSSILSAPFAWLARVVFRLDGRLFSVFLLSIIGGYPVGAKIIGDKVRSGEISSQTGAYLLNFCVNCSPAFLISYLSVKLWNSVAIGVLLFCSQTLSCILIAFVTGFGRQIHQCHVQSAKQQPPLSTIVVNSVVNATKTLGVLCSFVLLFCAIYPLLAKLPMPDTISFFLRPALEVISGVQEVAHLPVEQGVLMASLFTSFGGACVYLQVFAMLNHTNIRFFSWFFTRLCYTGVSVVLTRTGLFLFDSSITCMSPSGKINVIPYSHSFPVAIGMMVLASMLLMISLRRK